MPEILVDADACPVKDEIYRVARRHGLTVRLVANAWMRTPPEPWIVLIVVKKDFDEADDRIVALAGEGDIVVTADIPLAARCLKKGARAIGPKGREFTENDIGDTVATRDLLAELREAGVVTSGPPPFTAKDRSRFLQGLEDLIRKVQRGK
jgi:uncharacterized protein YaiI (UPF0178 family)